MFGIVLSALFSALGFLVRAAFIKFVTFTALFLLVTAFAHVLQTSGYLPKASTLNGLFGGIPGAVWYFMDLFAASVGIPAIISAFVVRFIIRRLPVIG